MRRAALAFGTIALAAIAQNAAAQTEETAAAWVKTGQTSAELALADLELLSSSTVQGNPYSILVTFWRGQPARDTGGQAGAIRTYRCFDLLDRAYSHAHCEVAETYE